MTTLLGVLREPVFSPGRVSDDTAILERTAQALRVHGIAVDLRAATAIPAARPAAVLAMCQAPEALGALDRWVGTIPIVNTPGAIRNCHRRATLRLLATHGAPHPPSAVVSTEGAPDRAPCWVKRADVHATAPDDVVYAADRQALARQLGALAARGIAEAVLQTHVAGTLVKFYGVGDGRFFRCFADGAEAPAPIEALWETAHAGAQALGLDVFGGDLIVPEDGRPVLIDVNDWPSFAPCRDEAADAIAGLILDRLQTGGRATASAGAPPMAGSR